MSWEAMTLTGWGRVSRARVKAYTPQSAEEIRAAVAAADDKGVLACGGGRSYGDVGLNSGGRALLTTALDRIRSFDPATGTVVCEPGVTFRQLLDAFLPHGYLAPVTPGTAFVSVAGAVANDVHGKNHDVSGSFGDHVEWIELLLPDGEIVRVSPAGRPDLFAATVGGIGLTGIMLAVGFKLLKAPSNAMRVREERIADIDAFLARLEEVRRTATYSIGWIDALSRGGKHGRGVLMTGEPSPDGVPAPARRRWKVGFDFPPLVLNARTVGAFNGLYYRRVPKAGRERLAHVERVFYPLDAIRDWNRLYGRRGFYQFQCVLPDAERGGVRRLLQEVSRWRVCPALATLKTLGSAGRGYLSFPMRGYTLALDFPNRPPARALLGALERITLDCGGRVYLAKDACLSPAGFEAMYPGLGAFRSVLHEIDPHARMQSDLARRLGIRERGVDKLYQRNHPPAARAFKAASA